MSRRAPGGVEFSTTGVQDRPPGPNCWRSGCRLTMVRAMSDRVLVAGAGALGSVFGGMLAAAGYDVTLLGRPSHLAAVEQSGLAIEGLFGTRRVPRIAIAYRADRLPPAFDAILLTV